MPPPPCMHKYPMALILKNCCSHRTCNSTLNDAQQETSTSLVAMIKIDTSLSLRKCLFSADNLKMISKFYKNKKIKNSLAT